MLVHQAGQTLFPIHAQYGGSLEKLVFASFREMSYTLGLSRLHLCWHPRPTQGMVVKPQTTEFQFVLPNKCYWILPKVGKNYEI